MPFRPISIILVICWATAIATAMPAGEAYAQRSQRATPPTAQNAQSMQSEAVANSAAIALPPDSVTSHTFSHGGQKFAYTARAGTLSLTNGKGAKTAEVFYVAFTRDDIVSSKRPVTFALNGGPGASSAYLDLLAIGPRILDLGDGRKMPTARARIVDNPDSWLEFTDLVFIDPVGTGYSIATTGDEEAQRNFFGVSADLDAIGSIIRLALTKLDRYASPVYLVGESYGGFRAARLPLTLSQNEGIAVSGVVLISPILEFSLLHADEFDPLPWAFKLSSYAAVNLERKGPVAPSSLKDAETYALGDFLLALAAPLADTARRAPAYAAVANLIGVPQATVERWNGRVPTRVFVKDLHRDEGEVVSRYDGSVPGADSDPAGSTSDRDDPVLAALTAPLTTGMVLYLRDELAFKTNRGYEVLNGDLGHQWNWGGGRTPDRAPGATSDLGRALALNPSLKVMVVGGMTDLVAPYLMNRYVIDHMPPTVAHERIDFRLYPGGHMMYLRPASRAALYYDTRALLAPP